VKKDGQTIYANPFYGHIVYQFYIDVVCCKIQNCTTNLSHISILLKIKSYLFMLLIVSCEIRQIFELAGQVHCNHQHILNSLVIFLKTEGYAAYSGICMCMILCLVETDQSE